MRKLAVGIGALLSALIAASAANATQPSPVSGTESILGASATVIRVADGNTIVDNVLVGTISGSFTGTFSATFTTIAHASGATNDVHGDFVCTCSYAGKSGTLTFRFEGTGTPSGTQLHGQTISATGGLEGLHSDALVDIVGPSITYSGTAHFD